MNIKIIREYSQDLNVLYVEDDKTLCHNTKDVLENYYKSVDIAYDGQEGIDKYLSYFEKNGYTYDLVITDINMPKMNGLELSSTILKENPEQSIIIISAHDEVSFLLEAIDIGIFGFLTKPLNNQKLMQVLYKSSMAIFDHKIVKNHVEHLEELTFHLEQQNRELQITNSQLEKSMRLLDTIIHKEEILHPKKELVRHESKYDKDFELLREQLISFTENDLFELMELTNECDVIIIDIINNIEAIDITSRSQLATLFKKYASTLAMYSFFNDFSVAFMTFANTLENNPLPTNEETIKNIFLFLETFIYDLNRWHNDLLSADESKINAFDASNITNMRLITNMWIEQEETGAVSLDAIFNF